MATSYYATRISENLSVTPEGFLLAPGVTLARTGFQKYRVAELPQDRAAALGLNVSDTNAFIDLYRPPEEVFDVACLASFEGKPLTLDHPADFVTPNNSREYTRGHIQNVRKGDEALSTGDWPMVGDLIVTDAALISHIQNGVRELSLGYEYELGRQGDKLVQQTIRGNHCAVVRAARAGSEARIFDAATGLLDPLIHHQISAEAMNTPLQTELEVKPEIRQSTKKGEYKVANMFAHLLGLGLKAMATDADTKPETLAEAARVAGRARDAEEEPDEEKQKKSEDSKRMRDAEEEEKRKKEEDSKRMKDAEESKKKEEKEAADKKAADEAEAEKKKEEDRKAADKAAKDAEPSHVQMCKDKKCAARDCRMHGALDGILKAHPESEDADVEELGKLMQEFMANGGEAGHDGAQMGSEVIEPISESEMGEDNELMGPGNDNKLMGPGNDKHAAADSAARDADEFAFLKRIRPIVAKSKDAAAVADFNARLGRFTRSSTSNSGSYSAAAGAGRSRGRATDGGQAPDKQTVYAAMEAELKKIRDGVPQEVTK